MKLHTAAILLLFWLAIFTVHTVKGNASSLSMRKFSCVTLSPKQYRFRTLVSYEKQQIPTEAIMFTTAKGVRICVSPDQRWVQAAMKRIDERRAAKGKQSKLLRPTAGIITSAADNKEENLTNCFCFLALVNSNKTFEQTQTHMESRPPC